MVCLISIVTPSQLFLNKHYYIFTATTYTSPFSRPRYTNCSSSDTRNVRTLM